MSEDDPDKRDRRDTLLLLLAGAVAIVTAGLISSGIILLARS